MRQADARTGVLVIGGGPAGMASLLAAAEAGKLTRLLGVGLMVLEAGPAMGSGGLKDANIPSDSTAESFLDIVLHNTTDLLTGLRSHPLVSRISTFAGQAVPLPLVCAFLDVVGKHVQNTVEAWPHCQVWVQTKALATRQAQNGEWITETYCETTGVSRTIVSQTVVLATGGYQPQVRLLKEKIAGRPLLPAYTGKVLQSGQVLTSGGMDDVTTRLATLASPRIAIVGSSASAGAVACFLHNIVDKLPSGIESCTLLHRSPIRLFYGSVTDADADGYNDYTEKDICPLTGRIHRFGGLRLSARDLIRSSSKKLNLSFHRLNERDDSASRQILDEADLIVAAFGYRPRALPVFGKNGERIKLRCELGASQPLVNSSSAVLDLSGAPIEGLFGIGLGTGRPWTPDLGGELSFNGQINSLWMWQHNLGEQLVDGLLGNCQPAENDERPNESMVSLLSSREHAKAPRTYDPQKLTIPFLRPDPPKLSEHLEALTAIERSGVFTNFGPVNTACEQAFVREMFKSGSCLLVCNATIGLMIAIREAIGLYASPRRRFALMPSFTFAAAAQAALWNGLTPLFCDIDPKTWLPCKHSEQEALKKYGDQIAVIIPYATFGNNLDLQHYKELQSTHGIPIVVDAAASLGSIDTQGNAFGSGFRGTVVYSMHATKPFSTGEGGILYSGDTHRVERLRTMSSFGFGEPRTSTTIGLNAKLSEVSALLALKQLERFAEITSARERVIAEYLKELPHLQRQQLRGYTQAHSFETVLLPRDCAKSRPAIIKALARAGINTGTYFSPHLAEQSFWKNHSLVTALPVTSDVASRLLSLPVSDSLTGNEIGYICQHLKEVLADVSTLRSSSAKRFHQIPPAFTTTRKSREVLCG